MTNEISTSELKHSWKAQQTSTLNGLARPIQYAPSTLMPSSSIVSYTGYMSQNYPQYGMVNEQQVQSKNQSMSPQITQTNVNTNQATR
jgi:paraquat-inducible protein B